LGLASTPAAPAPTSTTSFGGARRYKTRALISAAWIPLADYSAMLRAKPNVSVRCTNSTPYIVDLCAGLPSGATVLNRWKTDPFSALLGSAPVSNFRRVVNRGQVKALDMAGQTGNWSSLGALCPEPAFSGTIRRGHSLRRCRYRHDYLLTSGYPRLSEDRNHHPNVLMTNNLK
jgi:hypothetical protein